MSIVGKSQSGRACAEPASRPSAPRSGGGAKRRALTSVSTRARCWLDDAAGDHDILRSTRVQFLSVPRARQHPCLDLVGVDHSAAVDVRTVSCAEAEHREVVVARIEDKVTLKRFIRISDRYVQLRPESTNPRHRPIKVNLKTADFAVAGIAVGALIGDGFNRSETTWCRPDALAAQVKSTARSKRRPIDCPADTIGGNRWGTKHEPDDQRWQKPRSTHEQRRPELDRELHLGHRRRRPPRPLPPGEVPRRHPCR